MRTAPHCYPTTAHDALDTVRAEVSRCLHWAVTFIILAGLVLVAAPAGSLHLPCDEPLGRAACGIRSAELSKELRAASRLPARQIDELRMAKHHPELGAFDEFEQALNKQAGGGMFSVK
jgi:hypothetical protein